jgi:hypothetical protein
VLKNVGRALADRRANFSWSKLSFHWHQKIFGSGKTLEPNIPAPLAPKLR